jgi:hypothetical protein
MIGLIAVLYPCAALSEANLNTTQFEAKAAFSYQAGTSDSLAVARALALYGAKYKSVVTLLGRLAEEGLIKLPGAERVEIMCLMAEELSYNLTKESFTQENRIYSVTIKGKLSLADVVRVEIMNELHERQESHFTLKEEMEPALSPDITPGRELSRAYRYMRKKRWRMAIIYLDHLERKYAHWGALFFAKAMAFQGMHETEQSLTSLSKACRAGTKEACFKLNQSRRQN